MAGQFCCPGQDLFISRWDQYKYFKLQKKYKRVILARVTEYKLCKHSNLKLPVIEYRVFFRSAQFCHPGQDLLITRWGSGKYLSYQPKLCHQYEYCKLQKK